MQHLPRPQAVQNLEQNTTCTSAKFEGRHRKFSCQEKTALLFSSHLHAARQQSNLDDPNDWDYAETQHIPLPSTCEETGNFAGAALVSHDTYSSRKRRNTETQKRQAKSLKYANRVAKRKLMAQPEISHALAEQLLRSMEPRTDEHFAGRGDR